jgi:16S rRNA G966 N2-methylase RsmD
MTPLSDQERDFISQHAQADTKKLMLSGLAKKMERFGFLIEQIEARQKLKTKLPAWVANPNSIFPKRVSTEQSSSLATAHFKASLVQGYSFADLTGGMGVDCFTIASQFKEAYYIEQNQELVEIATHNANQFGLSQITCIHANGIEWLSKQTKAFDWIYMDPARRDTAGQKTHLWEACEPNLKEHISNILSKTSNVLVKASPMLDISLAQENMPFVQNIYVVSAK